MAVGAKYSSGNRVVVAGCMGAVPWPLGPVLGWRAAVLLMGAILGREHLFLSVGKLRPLSQSCYKDEKG